MKNSIFIILLLIVFSCDSPNKKEFYPNGSLKNIIEYKNDKIVFVKEFYPDGKKKKIIHYKDGIPNGEYTYYTNGILAIKFNLIDSLIEGENYEYYKNGKLASLTYYKKNKKNGYGYFYAESGELVLKAFFEKDSYKSGLHYNKMGNLIAISNVDNNNIFRMRSTKLKNQLMEITKDTILSGEKKSVGLIMNEYGKIESCIFPINFLTKMDTIELSKTYPDWIKQIQNR
jgi:hypothetical protein